MELNLNKEIYKINGSLGNGAGTRELNRPKLNFDALYISNPNYPLEFRVKAYLEFKKEHGATLDVLVKVTKSKSFFDVMKLVNTDFQIKLETKHMTGGFCKCNDLSKGTCTARYLLRSYAN